VITFQTSEGIDCLLDDEDADLAQYTWHIQSRHGPTRQYTASRGLYARAHLRNIITSRKLGRELEEHEECFNKNKNLTDCRRENILIGTRQQIRAHAQKRSNNTTGYKGVSFEKSSGRWVATIKIDGKTKWLGRYSSPEEAARAYNQVAQDLFGEYAWLNDIPAKEE
jgi:hypothetical protein